MRKRIFILFYFGFSLFVLGQEISDFKKKLQLEFTDTTRVSLNLKIADLYFDIDKDSSFYYNNQAVELANKIASEQYIANSLYRMAIFHDDNSDYEKAIKNYLEASTIFEKLNNTLKVADIYNYVADSYLQLYVEDKAIDYYLKSLKLYKNIANEEGVAMIYMSFGDLFYTQENYNLAEKYFKDALEIYIKLDDKDGIATCYTNLGNAIAEAGDDDAGLEYYKKSIEIQEGLDEQYGIAINYNNIGDSYIQLKLYDKSLDYFFRSLSIAEKLDDKSLKSVVLMNIADVKIKEGKYNSGVLYAKKSLKLAKEIGDLEYRANNLILLSDAYEGLGNMSEAYSYNKQYIKIKDSLLKIDKTNKVKLFHALSELETSLYTISDLSSKTELAELKYKNEKKITYFLIITMTIFAFFIILSILQQTSKKKAYNLLEYKNYLIHKMKDEIQTQRDDLKLVNATKDRFFSIIAHDLKNPFNSIKGFTELMIENSHEYDEEKRLKFLKIIRSSSTRASNLLDNLLLWANSQSGDLKFDPQKVNLAQQVEDVNSLLEIQAINKEIKILNTVDTSLFIDADKNMLDTILRNLVSNAIKFTKPKGEVQIYSSVVNNFVEITVKDNGVGMEESSIENLFDIDVKNSTSGTSNEQGSGLGLILCKDFAEKHGGKLWIKSVIGKGSEFMFTLPKWEN